MALHLVARLAGPNGPGKSGAASSTTPSHPSDKDDAEYIATHIQTLTDARKRRPVAAKRAHPDAGESQEETDHAERQ